MKSAQDHKSMETQATFLALGQMNIKEWFEIFLEQITCELNLYQQELAILGE